MLYNLIFIKLVEARGVEPLSSKPLAQMYYKLSRCYLLDWHVTDERPTRVSSSFLY